MFKCEKCRQVSQPGETSVKVTLSTRQREYLAFKRLDGTQDRGGIGNEIAREVVCHAACAEMLKVEMAAYAAAQAAVDEKPVYSSNPSTGPFNGIR
jgi:hypothetical protein